MADKVVTFQFTALGTRTWTPDADYLVQQVLTQRTVALSIDPSLTSALMTTPSAGATRFDILVYQPGLLATPELKIPVSVDKTYFVCCSGAGSVSLMLDNLVVSAG